MGGLLEHGAKGTYGRCQRPIIVDRHGRRKHHACLAWIGRRRQFVTLVMTSAQRPYLRRHFQCVSQVLIFEEFFLDLLSEVSSKYLISLTFSRSRVDPVVLVRYSGE
jgi:hypothetical protein